ncbi:esterase/lipase family protein [Gloeothece citriformis]|uniref:esterase/lipase family protein n=1 Tax=Gloeothece citriformis TaxID=2546356 RepID=UPI000173B762|nr:alpha/beta hydrolase [Gloeothece citriformis]
MTIPAVILPGYFSRSIEYQELEKSLNNQGIPTTTVPITKRDWIPTIGGRSMMPILRLIDRTVQETLQKYNCSQVNLIGHSAGGWIARIYLGEKPYDVHGDVLSLEAVWNARTYVNTLITLGTPHISQERWTKRNLEFMDKDA